MPLCCVALPFFPFAGACSMQRGCDRRKPVVCAIASIPVNFSCAEDIPIGNK
ncbi:hypothetical protein H4V98_003067 [Polaromonas sp. CG_23.6]|nr:hypothetical protein [Polaromonas sp. CG_23.6]